MASLGQLKKSFVGKFISLWKAGYDANFDVTFHSGEARVNLEVGLGRVPDDVVVIPPSTCQGRLGPAMLDNEAMQDVQNCGNMLKKLKSRKKNLVLLIMIKLM